MLCATKVKFVRFFQRLQSIYFSENEVLLRCIAALLWCYASIGQEKAGQILVLFQANWNSYAIVFTQLVEAVLSKTGLKYDNFFRFIVNILIALSLFFLSFDYRTS